VKNVELVNIVSFIMKANKYIIFITTILIVNYSAFAQEVDISNLFEKDDYLICSKKTKEPFTGIMFCKNSDGKIEYKKTVVDGIENGKALFYDKSGNFAGDGEYFNGLENGKWTWYYKSGFKKAIGYYKDGISNGHWTYWSESGIKEREGNIINGKENGKWEYYSEMGLITTERYYNYGLKDSVEIWYYENGQKMSIHRYESGIENGKFEGWFRNGKKKFESYYRKGEIINYTEWDQDGKIIKSQNKE